MTRNRFFHGFFVSLLAAAFALFARCGALSLAEAADGVQHITVFHTNDMHARMVKGDDNGKSIGFAEFSAAVKAAKANDPNTLWFDAGDTLHGMPYINISRGMNVVALLNETCVDALSPGNHDFNYGAAQLNTMAKKLKLTVLSANVVDKDTGKRMFKDRKIYRLPSGLKVGVFGLTTPETAYKTSPLNVQNVKFLNPIEVSQEMVRKLRPKCDVIIALMHMGVDASSEFTSERIAKEVPHIDLIVDGHSHTALPEGLMANDTLIVQTGSHGYKLGRATITLEGGNITAKSAELLDAEGVKSLAPVPDAKVLATLDKIKTKNAKLFDEVVTHTERALSASYQIVRRQEAELGNLCADAIRWRTNADIAVIGGGDMRVDLPAGDVTRGDIMATLPFGNTIQMKNITGQQIKAMLEHSVAAYPTLFGGFLHVSGATFVFSPAMPAGSRVSDVKINGTPLDENKTYTIAATEFLFVGGDDYDMLKDLPTVGEFDTCESIVIDYINKVGMKNIEVGRVRVVDGLSAQDEEATNVAA